MSYPAYDAPQSDVFVSKRLADDPGEAAALISAVRARLEEGERLYCILAICKIAPPLEVLMVTDRRVLAEDRADLARTDQDWSVQLAAADVDRIEVTGFMDNVKFVGRDGKGTKVGNLWDVTDEEPLRAAVRSAQSSEGDPAAPPTYELYHRADPPAE